MKKEEERDEGGVTKMNRVDRQEEVERKTSREESVHSSG